MEKVKFTYSLGDNYTVEVERMLTEDGEGLRDFSGEYVRAEVAEELLAKLKEIYECGDIRQAEIIAYNAIKNHDPLF